MVSFYPQDRPAGFALERHLSVKAAQNPLATTDSMCGACFEAAAWKESRSDKSGSSNWPLWNRTCGVGKR